MGKEFILPIFYHIDIHNFYHISYYHISTIKRVLNGLQTKLIERRFNRSL